MQPRVLLFDEPLSNLDAKLRKRVREEIRDLQQELGITSLYVTHDQEEAMAISDLVVLMNKGVIEQQGTHAPSTPGPLAASPPTSSGGPISSKGTTALDTSRWRATSSRTSKKAFRAK